MEYEPGESHHPKAESRGKQDFLRHHAGKNKRKRNATLTQESYSLHFEGQRYRDGNTEAPKPEYRNNMADITYMENHRPNKASYTMYSPILDRKSGPNAVSKTGDFCSRSKLENDKVIPHHELPRCCCLHDHDSESSGTSQGHLISAYDKNTTKNCKLSTSSNWNCGINRKIEYLRAKERQSDPALVKRCPQNSHSEPKQYEMAKNFTHLCDSDSDASDKSTSNTASVNSGRGIHKSDGYHVKTFRLKSDASPCDVSPENHPYRRLERKHYISNRKGKGDKHTAKDERSSLAKCDVKPFNTTILYDVKPFNKSTSGVKPCTAATATDVKPYSTATVCDVKPYSTSTVCDVKPYSTATVCDVKPYSVSTRTRDVKPTITAAPHEVKPYTPACDVKPHGVSTRRDVGLPATTHEVRPYTAECDVTHHKASTFDVEPNSTLREVNKQPRRPNPTPRDSSKSLPDKKKDTLHSLEKTINAHKYLPAPYIDVSSYQGDVESVRAASKVCNHLDPHRREDSARTPWTCTKWVDQGDKAWTCEVYSDTAIPEVASAHVVKTYIDNRKPKPDQQYQQQRYATCDEVKNVAQCTMGNMDESKLARNPGNSVDASRQAQQRNSLSHTELNGRNEFKGQGEFSLLMKDNNASNTHIHEAPYGSEALRLIESQNYFNEDIKEQTPSHHSENKIGSWIENKLRPNQTLTMENSQVVSNPALTSCSQGQYISYLTSETFKPTTASDASKKNDTNLQQNNQHCPEDTKHCQNNEPTSPNDTNMMQCKYEKRSCLTGIIEKMSKKSQRAKSVDKATQSETVYAIIAGHPVPIISSSDTDNATYYTASTSGFDKNQTSLRSSVLADIPHIFENRTSTDIQDKISYEEYKSGRKRYAERQEKRTDYEIEELTYEIENNTDKGKQIHCRSKCHLPGKKYGPNIKPHLHFNYTKSSEENKLRKKSPLRLKPENDLSYTNISYVDKQTVGEVHTTNDGDYVTCEESNPKQTSSSASNQQTTIRDPRRKQKSPDMSQGAKRKKRRKRKTPVPLSAKSSKVSVSDTSVYKGKRKKKRTPKTARSATDQSSLPVFVIAKPGSSAHKSVSKVDQDAATKTEVQYSLSFARPPLPSGGKGMEPVQRTSTPTEPYKMDGMLIIPNPSSRITRRLVEGSKEKEKKKATQVVNVPTFYRNVEQQCSTNELLQDGGRRSDDPSAFTWPSGAPRIKRQQHYRQEKISRYEEQNPSSESEQVSTINTNELNASIMRLYEEIHKLKLQLDASTDASLSSCGPYLDHYDVSPASKLKKERDEVMKNSSASSSRTKVPLKKFRKAQSPGDGFTAKQLESKPKSFKVKLFQATQKEECTNPKRYREDSVKAMASPNSQAGHKLELAKADKKLKFCQQSPAKLRPRHAHKVKEHFDPSDPQPCFNCVKGRNSSSGSVREVDRSYGSVDDFTSQDSSSEPIEFRKMKSETGQDSSSGGSSARARNLISENYELLREITPEIIQLKTDTRAFRTSHFVLTAKDDYSPVETCFTGSSCLSRSSSEAGEVSELGEEDKTLHGQNEEGGDPPEESSSARLKRLDEMIQLLINPSSPASSTPSQTSQLFVPGPSQIIGDGKHVDNCSNQILQHVLPCQQFSNYSSPDAGHPIPSDSDQSLSQSTSDELHCSVCESSPASLQDHPTLAKSESGQNNDNNSRLDDGTAESDSSRESAEQNIPVSLTCGKLKIFGNTRDTTIKFYKNMVLELPEAHQKMSRMLMPQKQARRQNQTTGEPSGTKASKTESAVSKSDVGSAPVSQGKADGDHQQDKTRTSGDTASAINDDGPHINGKESSTQKDSAKTEIPSSSYKIPPRDQKVPNDYSSPYIRPRSFQDRLGEQIVPPFSEGRNSQTDILPGITMDAIDMTTKKLGIDLNTTTKEPHIRKVYEPNDSYSDFREAEAPVGKKKPLNSRRMYNKSYDSKPLNKSSAKPPTQRYTPTAVSPESNKHSQQSTNSTKSDASHNPSNDKGKDLAAELAKDKTIHSEPLTAQQNTNPGVRAATGRNDRTFVASDTRREKGSQDNSQGNNKQLEFPNSGSTSAEKLKTGKEGERHTHHSPADSAGNSTSSEAYAGLKTKSETRNLGIRNPRSSSDAQGVAEPGQESTSVGGNTSKGHRRYVIQLSDNKSQRKNENNSYDSMMYGQTSREGKGAVTAQPQLPSEETLRVREQEFMRLTRLAENCNGKLNPDTDANSGPKARRRLKIPYHSGRSPSGEKPALDPSAYDKVDTMLAPKFQTSQGSPREFLTPSPINTNSNHGTNEACDAEGIKKKKFSPNSLNLSSDAFAESGANQPVLCIPESVAYIAGRKSRRHRQLNKNPLSPDLADSSFKMLNLVDCVKNMFFKNSKAFENSGDVSNHAHSPKSRSPVNRPTIGNMAEGKDCSALKQIHMQEFMRPGYITSRKNRKRISPTRSLDSNKSYQWHPPSKISPRTSPLIREVSKLCPPSLDKEPPLNETSKRASSEDELWISGELSVCSNIPIVETPLQNFQANQSSKELPLPCQEVEFSNKAIPHYSDAIRRRFTQSRSTVVDEAAELYGGLRWEDQPPREELDENWMSRSFDDARIHINDFNFTGEFDIQFEKFQYQQPNTNDDDPENIISSFERMMQDKKPCYAEQCGLNKKDSNSVSSQKTDGNNSSNQCEFIESDRWSGPQSKEKREQHGNKGAVEPEGKDRYCDVCQGDAGIKSLGSRHSPARSYGGGGEKPDENWRAVEEEEEEKLSECSDDREQQAELAEGEHSDDFSEGTALEGSYDVWYEQNGEDTGDDVETIEDEDVGYQEVIGDDEEEDEAEEEDEDGEEDEEGEHEGGEAGNEEEDDNEEEESDDEDDEDENTYNKNGNNN